MEDKLESNIPDDFAASMVETQESKSDALLSLPNVVGVGLGYKETDGRVTDEQCITVFVSAKLDKKLLAKSDRVKRRIDGVATDVQEIGEIHAGDAWSSVLEEELATSDEDDGAVALNGSVQALRGRTRPALGGFSVGHRQVTAGTIGTACYDLSVLPGIPPRYYILSNNHVLANSNNANIGDPVLQPGRVDGGRYPADVIGRLSRFVTIRFKSGSSAPCNYVDAAVAEVPFHLVDRRIFWVGTVKGLYAAPRPGDIVQKTGRTTNFTTGRVQSVNATVDVNYGQGRVARFCRQIVTSNMSAGGDSGSLITDRNERGVGLLFAGSSRATIANHLNYVQALLGVRISES